MRLEAFVVDGHRIEIRPAPVDRPWMDNTPDRFAYRCLPLSIANSYGWEICCRSSFSAKWNGAPDIAAISVTSETSDAPAVSHFGSGVLTFHIPCVFRTDPGFDLLVQGPINRPKDGIAPLTAVVETDWTSFTFTMNWIFTGADLEIRFEKSEQFCHVFPVQRGLLETVMPRLRELSENPELNEQYDRWLESRTEFLVDLSRPNSMAQKAQWQKHYYRGTAPSNNASPIQHRTRLRVSPFNEE